MKRAHRRKKSTTKLNRLPVAALKADAVSIATEFVQALEIAAAVAADASTEINDALCDDDKESGGASVLAAAPQPLSLLHRLLESHRPNVKPKQPTAIFRGHSHCKAY